MLMVTSLLDRDRCVVLPDALHEQWGVEEGQEIYISVDKGTAILRKKEGKHAFVVNIGIGFSILLPRELIKKLNFLRNSEMVLTLKDGIVTLEGGKVVNLFPSPREKFEDKVRKELSERTSKVGQNVWEADAKTMENICMFLILSTWDDELIEKLIDKPKLLEKLARDLNEDEEYQYFFERKMRELVLQEGL